MSRPASAACGTRARPARPDAQKKTRHAAEQERPDVAAARDAWRERQPGLNPARLLFIDETWATTNMARARGRCPRGQRLRAAVPHGHWKTSTFVAALRNDGITAPFVIDGDINGIVFRAYVETVLPPALVDGDIVIMDNLGSYKIAGVREAIAARGVSPVYLPAHSPISIRSNRSSPSSRNSSEAPPLAPLTPSGPQSANSSIASHHRNAPTSQTAAIDSQHENARDMSRMLS